jgi:hypothetical protein
MISDRFDLAIRKARTVPDPSRRLDCLLGLLFGLDNWVLWNTGSPEKPWPAITEDDDGRWLVVFANMGKAQEYLEDSGVVSPPLMTVPLAQATEYCGRFRIGGVTGLLVNPGADAFTVTLEAVEAFEADWKAAGAQQGRGFWIPNLTSEEEDFWQSQGL